MNLITLKQTGYDFIKVGRFCIAEIPCTTRYNNDLVTELCIELQLANKHCKEIGSSAYLITVDGDPVYASSYSNHLGRSLLVWGNYTIPEQELRILLALKAGKEVDFYLARSVFANLNGRSINVSTSIEQDIIQFEGLSWNKAADPYNPPSKTTVSDVEDYLMDKPLT